MFRLLESQSKVKTLEKRIDDLEAMLGQATTEVQKAHKRINLANTRTANIEHYIGMRSHNFEDGGRMWDYMQLHKDIENRQRPQSLFITRQKRQAA